MRDAMPGRGNSKQTEHWALTQIQTRQSNGGGEYKRRARRDKTNRGVQQQLRGVAAYDAT